MVNVIKRGASTELVRTGDDLFIDINEPLSIFYSWKTIDRYFNITDVLDTRENEPVTVIELTDIDDDTVVYSVKIIPLIPTDISLRDVILKDSADQELIGASLANHLDSRYFATTYGYIPVSNLPDTITITKMKETYGYILIFMEYIEYSIQDIFIGQHLGYDTQSSINFFMEVLYAIYIGRKTSGFSHNDLHMGNIRLIDISENRHISEINGIPVDITFTGQYMPCIIDFGGASLNDVGHSDILKFISNFVPKLKQQNIIHKYDIFHVTDEFDKWVRALKQKIHGSTGIINTDHSSNYKYVGELLLDWFQRDQHVNACISCHTHMNLKYCGNCMSTMYCSEFCQQNDYKNHKCKK